MHVPTKDPNTDELYAITYNIEKAPYLTLYHFDNSGNLTDEINIEKTYPTMIHDFLITKHYVVIIDAPVIFDLNAIADKKNILQWRRELNLNIALIHRDNLKQKPIWLKALPFFAYHYANAYEKNECIEIIGAHYSAFVDSADTKNSAFSVD